MKRKADPAKVLEEALARFRGDLTVADAAAKAGLPLRDAEEALRSVAAEYSGHLSATSKGELIYSFPKGLVRPPEARGLRRFGRAVAKAALAVGRFVLRAWVSVVLVGYALVFLALMLAWALRSNDDNDGVGDTVAIVFRMIAEALFWTFHPFSPVYIGAEPGWVAPGRSRKRRVPFYERVNRFVFGPPKVERDRLEEERTILAEIRRRSGRIAPADVTRVTGLKREEAERLLLRLVVDYHGDIEVTEGGAIIYKFTELRATARAAKVEVPQPIWGRREVLPPLTGNSGGSNLLFIFINGFNLIASGFAMANGLTLERLAELFAQIGAVEPPVLSPPEGTPIVLGVVPLAFSIAVFALPLLRALGRPAAARRVAAENGWRGLVRLALANRERTDLTREELARAWVAAGGHEPTDEQLRDAVRALGGELDIRDDGTVVYRFEVLDRELQALATERARAGEQEASPGEVVFSSADEGTGIREGETGALGPEERERAALPDDEQDEGERREQRLLEGKPTDVWDDGRWPGRAGERDILELIERARVEARRRKN